jgi:hypothetical protein
VTLCAFQRGLILGCLVVSDRALIANFTFVTSVAVTFSRAFARTVAVTFSMAAAHHTPLLFAWQTLGTVGFAWTALLGVDNTKVFLQAFLYVWLLCLVVVV